MALHRIASFAVSHGRIVPATALAGCRNGSGGGLSLNLDGAARR